MIRFYIPEICEECELPENESGHCIRVLRMKEGDILHAVDGKGRSYECEIIDAHPKHARIRVVASKDEPKHWKEKITLAVAPTKNIDRIEWMLEKVVEMGVDEIVLLSCAHSERKKVNEERLLKIIVSAMKQSLKSTIPEFKGLVPFNDFIKNPGPGLRFMGYCDEEVERKEFVRAYPGNTDVIILIGPEGDFSPEEVAIAIENGYIPVTFGESRLRTETAALYGVSAIHIVDTLK